MPVSFRPSFRGVTSPFLAKAPNKLISTPVMKHKYRTVRAKQTANVGEEVNEVARHSWLQKLGQNFNGAGILFFLQIAFRNQSLVLPHFQVASLSQIDWMALKRAGFKGCVFDKDNTLTAPYALEIHPEVQEALLHCREAFGDDALVLYSNSAGLTQYDPAGDEALMLERSLGIQVLRHKDKKPGGGPDDLQRHFRCPVDQLIMVGDRFLTDVAFGNRLGMLTIRPQPFTKVGEPTMVKFKLDSGRAPQSIHSETDASATLLRAWLNLSLNPPRCVQDCSCEDVMRRHLVETMTAHQRDICGPIEKISQRIMAGRISCCMSSQSILNAGAAVEALLSYDAQWLRVALELLAVGSPRTMSLQISKQGLMRHLFTDPQNALATLKAVPRLLHVIALIDRSAMHPPLGTPLLFACRDGNAPGRNSHISSRLHHHPRSAIKSSAAMLQAVVGPLLGEADCGRYLSRFGYKVSFVQTPLNEALDASMAISNLAVDFRDGVRLCRLSQRLTGRYLLQQVRFPAIKRPDRLFNVELALNSLAGTYPLPKFSKSASKGTSRALGIVDGDKSTTMGLLWHLVMANHLPRLLTPVSLWAATNCGAREQSAFARQVVETYLNTIDTVPGGLMHTIFKLHGQFLCPLLQWIESFLKEEEKICGSGRTLTGLLEDGTLVCRIVGERCWPERGQHRNYEAALTALLKQQNTSKGDSGGSGSSSESPFWWSVIGCPPARSGRVSISSHKSKADTEACAIMFVSALCFEMLEKKKEHYAATIIQRRWRAVCDPRVPAAVAIQAAWRGFRARRAYFDHHVVPRIAAACLVRRKHMVEAVNAFKTLRRKQEVETTRDRLKVLAQTMAEFAVKSAAATKIQRAAREYLQRKMEKEKNKDENKAHENVDARPCPMKNQMPKETKRRPALRELTNCTKHTVLL